VEVVPRDASLQGWVAFLDFRLVVLDDAPHDAVDMRFEVALFDDFVVLLGVDDDLPGVDERAVREDDFQLLGVGVGDSVPHGVCPGGVVADAAADGRSRRRRRVGRELQPVRFERGVEVVLNDARLDRRPARLGVDVEYRIEVS
jgi:hypothetical protein